MKRSITMVFWELLSSQTNLVLAEMGWRTVTPPEWHEQNPWTVFVKHYQRQFSIKVWMEVISDHLSRPVELPGRLDGNRYLEFLQETLLILEECVLKHALCTFLFFTSSAAILVQMFPNRWWCSTKISFTFRWLKSLEFLCLGPI